MKPFRSALPGVTSVPASRTEIPLTHVVPGDILHLSAGDIVPADVRVLAAKDLFVNQASLTGESLPVEKFGVGRRHGGEVGARVLERGVHGHQRRQRAPPPRWWWRPARAPTSAASPRALPASRSLTSFDRGVNRFIWLMIRFMLVMVPLVFLVNGLTKGDWLEAFLFAVAVAVGLTPEMLPDDRDHQPGQGRDRHVRQEGHRQAPELDPEPRRDGRAVHRQDRHADAGQGASWRSTSTSSARSRERVLEYAYLNSYYQTGLKNLLDVAVLEHVEVHEHLRPDAKFAKIDESPVRLPAAADVGRRRRARRAAHPDLQGRGRGGLQRLQPCRAARRSRRAGAGTP